MVLIREATKQDFPAICILMKNELGYPNLDEYETMKRLESFSSNSDMATFVAVTEGVIAGFVGIGKIVAYEIDGDYTQILALAVSDKARRMGIGTALIKCVEEWSLSRGIKDIYVRSNEKRQDAHAFYENCGFIRQKVSVLFSKELSGAT